VPEFNDEIWKRSIHTLFRPMVGFHFPELHPLIDWNREPAFLEEELANPPSGRSKSSGATTKRRNSSKSLSCALE